MTGCVTMGQNQKSYAKNRPRNWLIKIGQKSWQRQRCTFADLQWRADPLNRINYACPERTFDVLRSSTSRKADADLSGTYRLRTLYAKEENAFRFGDEAVRKGGWAEVGQRAVQRCWWTSSYACSAPCLPQGSIFLLLIFQTEENEHIFVVLLRFTTLTSPHLFRYNFLNQNRTFWITSEVFLEQSTAAVRTCGESLNM